MIKEKLFILSQYVFPQHLFSRAVGLLANCKIAWIKNFFINWFIKRYHVNMQEALLPLAKDYPSFNDFFTRKLQANARKIDLDDKSIICPVDGAISQLGTIMQGKLVQAKGFDFTVAELLGGDEKNAAVFDQGLFATLYLAPKDYHCIHMPFTGTLEQMTYIPGDLFSVNQTTVTHVPQLFARNERVVCLFKTDFGPMAVVLVGAIIVASIHTAWAGSITPPRKKAIITTSYPDGMVVLQKGDLLGHFQLGSTAIVLLPKDVAQFCDPFTKEKSIVMGQAMARCY